MAAPALRLGCKILQQEAWTLRVVQPTVSLCTKSGQPKKEPTENVVSREKKAKVQVNKRTASSHLPAGNAGEPVTTDTAPSGPEKKMPQLLARRTLVAFPLRAQFSAIHDTVGEVAAAGDELKEKKTRKEPSSSSSSSSSDSDSYSSSSSDSEEKGNVLQVPVKTNVSFPKRGSCSKQATEEKDAVSKQQKATTKFEKHSRDVKQKDSHKITNDSTAVHSVGRPTDSTAVRSVSRPTDSTAVRSASRPTDSTAVRSVSRPTDSTAVRSVSRPTDSTAVRSVSRPTDSTAVRSVSKPTDTTAVRGVGRPTDSTVVRNVSRPTDSTAVRSVSKPKDNTAVRGVSRPTASTAVRSGSRPTDGTAVRSVSKPTETKAQSVISEPSLQRKSTTSRIKANDATGSQGLMETKVTKKEGRAAVGQKSHGSKGGPVMSSSTRPGQSSSDKSLPEIPSLREEPGAEPPESSILSEDAAFPLHAAEPTMAAEVPEPSMTPENTVETGEPGAAVDTAVGTADSTVTPETEASAAAHKEPFDNSTYQNLQHHSFTPYTFMDIELELSKFRLPQPSSGRPSPRH